MRRPAIVPAVLALAGIACAVGCAKTNPCGTPDTTSPAYSCAPHSIDAGGCAAIDYPDAETVDGAFPFGCQATFPACSGYFDLPNSIVCTCQLGSLHDAMVPEWICPN
jgi:hypothetical protein